MKRFHRFLAMMLAIVTTLSILPFGVLADSWISSETVTDKDGEAGVTDTRVILTVDPEVLLDYIKSGDKEGLLAGISFEGLGDIFTEEELLEIFPEEAQKKIVETIMEDVDLDVIMDYVDVNAIAKEIDPAKLIDKIKQLDSLESYIKEGGEEILADYLAGAEFDLSAVIDCINVEKVLKDHSAALVELILELESDVLLSYVEWQKMLQADPPVIDLKKVVTFDGVDLGKLFDEHVDKDALLKYLDEQGIDLSAYIKESEIGGFVSQKGASLTNYILFDKLRDLVETRVEADRNKFLTYLDTNALAGLVAGLGNSDFDKLAQYVNQDRAYDILMENLTDSDPDNDLVSMEDLLPYVDIPENAVNVTGLLDSLSDADKTKLINALLDGDAIDFSLVHVGDCVHPGAAIKLITDSFAPGATPLLDLNDVISVLDEGYFDISDMHKLELLVIDLVEEEIDAKKNGQSAPFIEALEAAHAFEFDAVHGTYTVHMEEARTVVINSIKNDATPFISVDDLRSCGVTIKAGMATAAMTALIDAKDAADEPLITAEVVKTLFAADDVIDLAHVNADCVDVDKAIDILVPPLLDGVENNEILTFSQIKNYVDIKKCTIDPNEMGALIADRDVMTANVLRTLLTDVPPEGEAPAVKLKEMLTAEEPVIALDELYSKNVFKINAMISGTDPYVKPDELKTLVNVDKILADLLAETPPAGALTLEEVKNVFDWGKLVGDINTSDLISEENGIVDLDVLLNDKNYGYDKLVDKGALVDEIGNMQDTSVLIDYVPDRVGLINKLTYAGKTGIDAVMEKTGLTYAAILGNYVTDKDGFYSAIDLAALMSEISADGNLENIFNVDALMDALLDTMTPAEMLEIVDINLVFEQLRANGGLKSILKSVSNETYLAVLNHALAELSANVHGVTINGTTVTVKDRTLLYFNVSTLIDVFLDDLLPELDDLVNMGDDGKMFEASLEITYAAPVAEEEGEEENAVASVQEEEPDETVLKTKRVTFEVVLASEVERVRNAAAKFKELTERYIKQDFNDGILTLDLRLPSKFASALAVALDALAKEGDPEIVRLKNEILDLYDANLYDLTAFLDNLTVSQFVALMEAVDASNFGKAYEKVITSHYVDSLLSFVSEKLDAAGREEIGIDLTKLTPEELLIRAGELPTVESLCDKIENLLGRNISAFDRLPKDDPVSVLQSLADRAGIDADLKAILLEAAEADDPFAALYQSAIDLVSKSEDTYEAVSGRVISVLNKALSSTYGQKIANIRFFDYYTGNSNFEFDKTVYYKPLTLVQRLVDKATALAGRKLDEYMVTQASRMLMNYFICDEDESGAEMELPLGVDVSLCLTDMYTIDFHEKDGEKLNHIRTAFLPKGVDLNKVQPYEPEVQYLFTGWEDVYTHELYTQMPAADVHVLAHLDDNKVNVFFYPPDADGPEDVYKDFHLEVTAGERFSDDQKEQMKAFVLGKLGKEADEVFEIEWYLFRSGVTATEIFDLNAPILETMGLTWKHYYKAEVVSPEDATNVKGYFRVPAGSALKDVEDYASLTLSMTGLVADRVIWLLPDGSELDPAAPVDTNLTLTWTQGYNVTFKTWQGADVADISVQIREGKKLSDYRTALYNAVREAIGIENFPTDCIDLYFYRADGAHVPLDNLDTVLDSDAVLTWKYYYKVTLQNESGVLLGTTPMKVEAGKLLNETDVDGLVMSALAVSHPNLIGENVAWSLKSGNVLSDYDFSQAVTADITLVYKISFKLKVVHLVEGQKETVTTLPVNGIGVKLSTLLNEMNNAVRAIERYQSLGYENLLDEGIDWFKFDDNSAVTKDYVITEDVELSWNAFFLVYVLDEADGYLDLDVIKVPAGGKLTSVQIDYIKSNVLSYVQNVLQKPHISAEDIRYTIFGTVNDWDVALTDNVEVSWFYEEEFTVTLWKDAEHFIEVPVLAGNTLTDDQILTIKTFIRNQWGVSYPDADIILRKLIGTDEYEDFDPETARITANVTLSWRRALYYKVELHDTDFWFEIRVENEGNHEKTLTQAQIQELRRVIREKWNVDYEDRDIILQRLVGDTFVDFVNVETDMITADTKISWRRARYYTVTVVNREDATDVFPETYEVRAERANDPKKLTPDQIKLIKNAIRAKLGITDEALFPDEDIVLTVWSESGYSDFDVNTVLSGDTKLSWRGLEMFEITVIDPQNAGNFVTYRVKEGKTPAEWNVEGLTTSVYDKLLAFRTEKTANDEVISSYYQYFWRIRNADGTPGSVYDLASTAVRSDLTLTWSYDYAGTQITVTVYDRDRDGDGVGELIWSSGDLEQNENNTLYDFLVQTDYVENGVPTGKTVWQWLEALVASDEEPLTDYLHEYELSWVVNASSTPAFPDSKTLEENIAITWHYEQKFENAGLGTHGGQYNGGEDDHYTIEMNAEGNWQLTMDDAWWNPTVTEPIKFRMSTDFLAKAATEGHGVAFSSPDGKEAVTLSPAILAALKDRAGTDRDLYLHYAPAGNTIAQNPFGFAESSGASYFVFEFHKSTGVMQLGNFDALDPSGEGVKITLPLGGQAFYDRTNDLAKTYVCIEKADEAGGGFDRIALDGTAYADDENTVTFAALHFSKIAIVNYYRVSLYKPHKIADGVAEGLIPDLPIHQEIASYPIDTSGTLYYPAGAVLPIRPIVGNDDHLTKLDILKTWVLATGREATVLPVSGTYTMPAYPISLQFEIAPKVYYVFYRDPSNALLSSLTRSYTAYTVDTPEELQAFKSAILSLSALTSLGDAYAQYTEENGWYWGGLNEDDIAQNNITLNLLKRSGGEGPGGGDEPGGDVPDIEDPTEALIKVTFYDVDGTTKLKTQIYTYSALSNLSAFPTVASVLGDDLDTAKIAYWIHAVDGTRIPDGYTAAQWQTLLNSSTELSVRLVYQDRLFGIRTDGNVAVLSGEERVAAAAAGTELTVKIATSVKGRIPTILVLTASGETLVKAVNKTEVKITMPAEALVISVSFAPVTFEYTDEEGNVQVGEEGATFATVRVEVRPGMSIDLAKMPKELVLFSVKTEDGSLILEYRYQLSEGFDVGALIEKINEAMVEVKYHDKFIINGMMFDSAEAALKGITTDAAFKEWSDQLDKNLYVGAFDQATSEDYTWIVILILGVLLLLILLIVVFYVLYIKAILKPCLFLKVVASIVSVFFALCMSLAAAWLWILKKFGFDEQRLLKKYPLAKKRKKNKATLEDSLDALKDADPNFEKTAHTVSEEQIAQKTHSVETEMYSFEEEGEASTKNSTEASDEDSTENSAEDTEE